MSDFVNRLLGRPDAAPVRPLVPSRFEPVVPLVRDEPLPLPPFLATTLPLPPALPDVGVPIEPEIEPVQPPRPEPTLLSEPEVRAKDIQAPTASEPALPPPNHPAPSGAPRAPDGAAPTPAVRRKAASPPVPMETPRPAPSQPAEPAPSVAAATRPAREPVTPPPVPHPAPPRHTHAVAPPAVLNWSPPKLAVAKTDPEPAVHITIGRVEVRAAAEPSPAPRRGPQRPAALGLDEYLRRKAGGR